MYPLEQCILDGDFDCAKQLADAMEFDVLQEQILYMAYDNESLTTYTFINYLLIENEK
ncbi:hypothetical protein JFL43_08900 [Viridibacillus sp. YIM B01967]|uniref:Uncharacterized protein n=1 Tax=Viridibacillus soli TaxID=2798301 RepID=A0ABS1H6D5_9BACL|nr:hypothetical protein [Viridibacillus soli]MBK3494977.1 hypothetical protein [Viridibacillus soli]